MLSGCTDTAGRFIEAVPCITPMRSAWLGSPSGYLTNRQSTETPHCGPTHYLADWHHRDRPSHHLFGLGIIEVPARGVHRAPPKTHHVPGYRNSVLLIMTF